MAKAKNPKLSFLTSFQICRPKKPCSMIKSPLSASSYTLSPFNSKAFDISFPGTPIPPPSTPSKVAPLASKLCPDDDLEWRARASTAGKKKEKKAKHKSKSTSPSINSTHPLKPASEDESEKHAKPRRLKRYGSEEWIEGEEHNGKKLTSGRVAACKVNQSCVVVKKSVDPYEDFRKSMSEMIMEKQMFEPEELEQLLMSFLSLNSRLHHRLITEAFMDTLKEVFCE